MVNAIMDGKNCLEPLDWDFLADDGNITRSKDSVSGMRHCAMYVNGELIEFHWHEKSNMVVLSCDAQMVADKFNEECKGGEIVAKAISEFVILLFQDVKK